MLKANIAPKGPVMYPVASANIRRMLIAKGELDPIVIGMNVDAHTVTVARWMRGETRPRGASLTNLCSYLKCTALDILNPYEPGGVSTVAGNTSPTPTPAPTSKVVESNLDLVARYESLTVQLADIQDEMSDIRKKVFSGMSGTALPTSAG